MKHNVALNGAISGAQLHWQSGRREIGRCQLVSTCGVANRCSANCWNSTDNQDRACSMSESELSYGEESERNRDDYSDDGQVSALPCGLSRTASPSGGKVCSQPCCVLCCTGHVPSLACLLSLAPLACAVECLCSNGTCSWT